MLLFIFIYLYVQIQSCNGFLTHLISTDVAEECVTDDIVIFTYFQDISSSDDRSVFPVLRVKVQCSCKFVEKDQPIDLADLLMVVHCMKYKYFRKYTNFNMVYENTIQPFRVTNETEKPFSSTGTSEINRFSRFKDTLPKTIFFFCP